MDQRTLQILITAKDEASKKLSSIGDSMKSTFKVASVAVAVAGTAMVAFGVSSVKAFADAEAQMAIFNTTVKNVKGATPALIDQLKKAGESAVKMGFDDEDATVSLGKLYQRTGDVTEAIKLNNLAMDLARAKGIDLSTASKAITLGLSGNVRALKEFGIELDETKTPMQNMMELQKVVAGQAGAFAGTIAGKMEVLKVTFGNLKESIGGALASLGVGGALEYVVTLLEKIAQFDFAGKFQAWRDSVVAFAKEFNATTGIVAYFKDILQVLADFFNTYLKPAWDSLMKTIGDNKEVLMQLSGNFLKFVGIIAGGVLIGAMVALNLLFTGIEKIIQAVVWVVDKLSDAILFMTTQITNAIQKLKEFKDAVANSAVGKFVGDVKGGAGIVSDWVKSKVNDAIIAPNGNIISTHPDDYLIATKNPSALGGGGMTINMNGGTYLSEDVAELLGDKIIKRLSLSTKL